MRIARRPLLVWLAVLGAPTAWTLQLWTGTGLTLAACGAAGRAWNVPVDAVTVAVTAAAAAVSAFAGASAVRLLRATRDASDDPPAGRVRFLATIGVAVSFLFGCLIVMTGVGIVFHEGCRQG